MKSTCKWAFPGRYKGVSPAKALECLRGIEARDGQATPKAIVEEARRRASPLHRCFDWDDTTAAEKYRISQAGDLVRHLVIVQKNGKVQQFRAFVHVADGKSRGFTGTIEAMGNPTSRDYVLRAALAELESAERKLRQYRELAKACASIRKAVREIKAKAKNTRAA